MKVRSLLLLTGMFVAIAVFAGNVKTAAAQSVKTNTTVTQTNTLTNTQNVRLLLSGPTEIVASAFTLSKSYSVTLENKTDQTIAGSVITATADSEVASLTSDTPFCRPAGANKLRCAIDPPLEKHASRVFNFIVKLARFGFDGGVDQCANVNESCFNTRVDSPLWNLFYFMPLVTHHQ